MLIKLDYCEIIRFVKKDGQADLLKFYLSSLDTNYAFVHLYV